MNKSVIISIQPKWCELIANGVKTIEVRKTRPKIETPFKCYIYCTMSRKNGIPFLVSKGSNVCFGDYRNACHCDIDGSVDWFIAEGKIIGEFMCDRIDKYEYYNELPYDKYNLPKSVLKNMCLICHDVDKYGAGKSLYGWHISDLKIYDTPKELGEFRKPCHYKSAFCLGEKCEYWGYSGCENFLTRPPQSWCYVEGL